MSMGEAADMYGSGTSDPGLATSTGFGVNYTNFEADMLYQCVCDYGYFEPDCSLRKFPCCGMKPLHFKPLHAPHLLSSSFMQACALAVMIRKQPTTTTSQWW